MNLRALTLHMALVTTACTSSPPTDTAEPDSDTDEETDSEAYEWGQPYFESPLTFFASDLPQTVRDGVNHGLADAIYTWGNVGPVEYWVMGLEEDPAIALIGEFCQRRAQRGEWDEESCMAHNTQADGEHNLYSYLQVGQHAVAQNMAMGSMGRNGNREWNLHLFSSSYPFGFVDMFENASPEEETKTLFHEYFHAVQHAHIQSMDFQERDDLLGPTWFVEGGAEYMANYGVSKGWANGTMSTPKSNDYPSFAERMQWKMMGGKQSIEEYCPDTAFQDISYADPCSYAAYELGAWGIAYLLSVTSQEQLLQSFYLKLNSRGWEGAFTEAFQRTPDEFYAEFAAFLALPIEEQLAILPPL
jgi:hypothetical protein